MLVAEAWPVQKHLERLYFDHPILDEYLHAPFRRGMT